MSYQELLAAKADVKFHLTTVDRALDNEEYCNEYERTKLIDLQRSLILTRKRINQLLKKEYTKHDQKTITT